MLCISVTIVAIIVTGMGESVDFYGKSVTPVTIKKCDFINKIANKMSAYSNKDKI